VLAILVEGAWSFEDLLVLLIVVSLGARLIDCGDNVVWSTMVILVSSGPFRSIMTTILMVATVVVAVVIVASFIGVIIVAPSRAVSTRILVEADFGFLGVGVLIGGGDHLANTLLKVLCLVLVISDNA
jgi:hypothetical protein